MPIPIEEISNIINDDTLITESTMHDHKMEIRTGKIYLRDNIIFYL